MVLNAGIVRSSYQFMILVSSFIYPKFQYKILGKLERRLFDLPTTSVSGCGRLLNDVLTALITTSHDGD